MHPCQALNIMVSSLRTPSIKGHRQINTSGAAACRISWSVKGESECFPRKRRNTGKASENYKTFPLKPALIWSTQTFLNAIIATGIHRWRMHNPHKRVHFGQRRRRQCKTRDQSRIRGPWESARAKQIKIISTSIPLLWLSKLWIPPLWLPLALHSILHSQLALLWWIRLQRIISQLWICLHQWSLQIQALKSVRDPLHQVKEALAWHNNRVITQLFHQVQYPHIRGIFLWGLLLQPQWLGSKSSLWG